MGQRNKKKNLRRARMTQVLKKRQDPQFQKSVLIVHYILSLDN